MQACTIFTEANPLNVCGKPAHRLLPLAIGANARMKTGDDALLKAYVPVCAHHVEYVPAGVHMAAISYEGDE